jgi:hypothetical protein
MSYYLHDIAASREVIKSSPLSEDPKGFKAGDKNIDRYAGNSPADHVDPSGEGWLDAYANWFNSQVGSGYSNALGGLIYRLTPVSNATLAGASDGAMAAVAVGAAVGIFMGGYFGVPAATSAIGYTSSVTMTTYSAAPVLAATVGGGQSIVGFTLVATGTSTITIPVGGMALSAVAGASGGALVYNYAATPSPSAPLPEDLEWEQAEAAVYGQLQGMYQDLAALEDQYAETENEMEAQVLYLEIMNLLINIYRAEQALSGQQLICWNHARALQQLLFSVDGRNTLRADTDPRYTGSGSVVMRSERCCLLLTFTMSRAM